MPSTTLTEAQRLRDDAMAWDAFVAGAPNGSVPQLDAWGRASRGRGWSSRRVVVDAPAGPVGAQLLVHRLSPGPWSQGYAPRGPVAANLDAEAVSAFSAEVRRVAGAVRIAHVVIDPAVPRGHGLSEWLRIEGWQPAPARRANRTRVIDLSLPPDALWSGLDPSARWSVNRARRHGIEVIDVGIAGLPDVETMCREASQPGDLAPGSFRTVVRSFIDEGETRVVVARAAGELLAALVLVPCGSRIMEVHRAATAAGAAQQAGHLMTWEAIRSSRERGFRTYDMWGEADPGIAEPRAGFGGREIEYVGTWQLVTKPRVERILGVVRSARGLVRRPLAIGAGSSEPGGPAGGSSLS